ncbi:MAG: UDP-N-acetylmuramate dehydrogenase [Phycisphaerae bacterium]
MSLFDDLGDICRCGVPLAPLTWFRLGGPAEYLIEPETEEQLATVVRRCRDTDTPIRFLGLGANVLIQDVGVSGVVIRLVRTAFATTAFEREGVTAGAGVNLTRLVMACVRRGLTGLEQVAGIPASVGGAIRMNCGGRFGEIETAVRSVRVMGSDGRIGERRREELAFGYRSCDLGQDLVVAVEFALRETDPAVLRKRYDEIWNYKQSTQPPLGAPSAGCIFRNPSGRSAGELLDHAGLKGLRHGSAMVSERHANFIVADPGGCAADVIELIGLMQRGVAETQGVNLVPEVQIW